MRAPLELPVAVREADLARRREIFTWLNGMLILICGSAGFLVLGPPSWHRPAGVFLTAGVVLGATLVAHLRGASLGLTSAMLVGVTFIGLSLVVLSTGGIGLAAPFALAMVPMLAVLFRGPRVGLLWAGLVLAELAALALLHANDFAFPAHGGSPGPVRYIFGLVWVLLLLGGVSLMFGMRSQAILRDLAETWDALDAARAEAHAASVARDRFLANMSHEIRTPMNGVMGMLDLLRDSELDAEQHHSALVAYRSAQSLVHLLGDIVDLARVESGELVVESEPVDLPPLMEEVGDLFRLAADAKGLALSVEIEPRAPRRIIGDANRLRQVLVNLVGNGLKFTSRGEVVVRVTGGPGGAVITVRDTGIGVPPEHLETIFQPFVQAEDSTTRRFGGTGLGLAISRQIVERMGGSIAVTSTEGVGSTFTVSLPLPEGAVLDEASRAVSGGHAMRFPSVRVLIVEDNPTNRLVAERILGRLGCETESVVNGRRAVERCSQAPFDLVLMDCQMPEMDGYEATRILRMRANYVPIVALTAHAMHGDRERCIEAGMNDYITKPVSRAALIGVLRRWGGADRSVEGHPVIGGDEEVPG